jgi:ATP-dependent DNA helicase RecG
MYSNLNIPIKYVKGVGPKISHLFNKKGIFTVNDALYFLPRVYEDRRKLAKIKDIKPLEFNLIFGKVESIDLIPIRRLKRPILSIKISDDTGSVTCKWFNYSRTYMLKAYKPGDKVFISGKASIYAGMLELHHPDIEVVEDGSLENKIHFGRIVPIYSETKGLGSKLIRRALINIIDTYVKDIKDYMPREVLERNNFFDLKTSLKNIHFPSDNIKIEDLENFHTPFQRRLAFDEFFFLELALSLRKLNLEKKQSFSFDFKKQWGEFLNKLIPFCLTSDQKKTINEIVIDMKKPKQMNRLIQGDVGSGKTIVSFYAMVVAVLNGFQATMIAPTEILAEQHYDNFKKLFKDNFKVELLKGSSTKKEKLKIKEDIEKGRCSVLIGTHAILEEDVSFKNLGLVVIDEQHRFGVMQRLKLINKGNPDVLILTATPIPRTLTMTVYGDLDVSIIKEKPKGRLDIVTRVVEERNKKKVYEYVKKEIKNGRQAYFVYPLVEESDALDLKDVKKEALSLSKEFKGKVVEIIHGKMRGTEKEDVMKRFKNGKIDILVSTTVIEVGVDVPNVSVMVIEHPERFGLSALHQLRGRIGRGSEKSVCVLVVSRKLSDKAKRRLKVMAETNDGFKIAEEDLLIRGPGELLGCRQHGLPVLKIGNLVRDMDIIMLARAEARKILSCDKNLSFTKNKDLKRILNYKYKDKIDLINS